MRGAVLVRVLSGFVLAFGAARAASAQSVVGDWATSKDFGAVVSASGQFVRSAYGGEAYHFQEDGSYWNVIVASGTLISGTAVVRGRYDVRGDRLVLTKQFEDWTPSANHARERPAYKNKPLHDKVSEYELRFADADVLKLKDVGAPLDTTLHRVPAPKRE